MKKVLFTLVIMFVVIHCSFFESRAAIATIKTEVDIKHKFIKGTVTIASSHKETVELDVSDGIQILSYDEAVKYNKNEKKYVIHVDELSPVILSYIKRPKEHSDIMESDFVSIYSSIVPGISSIGQTELYVTLPEGFKGMVNGFSSVSTAGQEGNTILFRYSKLPREIVLSASQDYVIKTITQNNKQIYTLLLQEHEKLSYQFLQKTAYYIEMYEKLFNTDFPYGNFIVIEDKRPFGHAMPGFAVFGKSIIDKPFVLERSLGHEVLHQYIGAAVGCSMVDGNFLEALTTYFSDYYYEKENRIKYRKDILVDYLSYAFHNSFPLKDFQFNKGRVYQSVGYGKGLMVLYMAKNKVGEEAFMNGIRRFIKDNMFQQTSWHNLLSYIGVSDDFYDYWINKKDNIALEIDKTVYDNSTLSFELIRKGGEKQLDVPYTHISGSEITTGKISTNTGSNSFSIKLKTDNDTFIIDDGYHLMRYLYPQELPAAFSFLFGADDIVFSGARNEDKIFKEVFTNIKEVVNIRKLSMHHVKDKNIIISMDNHIPSNITELFSSELSFKFELGKTTYIVIKNPYSQGDKFIMFSFKHTPDSLKKLKFYGSYFYTVFQDDKIVEKKEDTTPYGIKVYGK